MYRRMFRSSYGNSHGQGKTSQFAVRPFAVQAERAGRATRHNDIRSANFPVQRKIDYTSHSERLTVDCDGPEKLIAALQQIYAAYGPGFVTRIREVVTHAENHGSWTLGTILRRLDEDAGNFPVPVNSFGFSNSGIMLPQKESSQRDYAFTQHTRATATVAGNMFEKESAGEHAEQQLEPLLVALVEEGSTIDVNEATLIVTINNFPCLRRCTPIMLKLKRLFPFMIINYANPYEEKSGEFRKAEGRLRDAGIALVPFEPRDAMTPQQRGNLTGDQVSRFDALARARTLQPRSTRLEYILDHGMQFAGNQFPFELEHQVIQDVTDGTLQIGDPFLVRLPDGSDHLFVYLGMNDSRIIIRRWLRGG